MKKLLGIILLLFTALCQARPHSDYVILYIRGLNSNSTPTAIVLDDMQSSYPDIPVIVGRIGDGLEAATRIGIYHQLDQLFADASTNPALAGKHVIVIGASQGGLVARAFIEMYADRLPFKIDGLITIASPIDGQYGLPDDWASYVDQIVGNSNTAQLQQIALDAGIVNNQVALSGGSEMISIGDALTRQLVTRDIFDPIRAEIARLLKEFVQNDWPLVRIVFYNFIGQDLISVANYWKDPLHKNDYLTFNTFLPYINNEKNHANAERYKANLASLNRIVFMWAGLDEVVKPPCSGGMLFYQWGSATNLEQRFQDTDQYKNNLLNMGYMFDNGRLFIEPLPFDGHGCISSQGHQTLLNHIWAIVDQPSPNDIFDAVIADDLATVESLITANPQLAFSKNGFNVPPIFYAGNKLAIAQYLFAQHLSQGHPLSAEYQEALAYNAVGSRSLAVLRWLVEDLHLNLSATKQKLLNLATSYGYSEIASYIQSIATPTLHQAVINNDVTLVAQIVPVNPALIDQKDAGGRIPIYYAGNKVAIAQYLFAQHLLQTPLTLDQLGELLFNAFGSGSIEVAQWIIETLYFDPTDVQKTLIEIATENHKPEIITYLQTFLAQNRPSIFTAVQQNYLALTQQIVAANPANVEQWKNGMLPIYYAGNKLGIAQYLYGIHQQLKRPLSSTDLGNLLYFACGAGCVEVAQWIIETLHFDPRPQVASLKTVASVNGQTQILSYFTSIGI